MSLIEINKPLLRLTREGGGGICPDTTIQFLAEPPSAVYSYPAGTFITVDLLDENGNYLQIVSYTQVGNNIDIVVDSDTPIAVNGTPQGDITNWTPIGVNLEDSGGNPVTPVSTALVGNILTIEITDPIVPSGVILQWPRGESGTSFRTGDPGWRAQNGWYDYTTPANPAKIALLDFSLGANFFWRLKTALTVNGVTSTVRFVDVDGNQAWPAVNNKDKVSIDKLSGLMFLRSTATVADWNAGIDDALAYSITVDGNTYSDWYLANLEEMNLLTGMQQRQNIVPYNLLDLVTPLPHPIITSLNGNMVTATTGGGITTDCQRLRGPQAYYDLLDKTSGPAQAMYIRDARNLIS